MHGEYGYMEEGQLGKPYNLRLLKRLTPFSVPHLRIILLALLLTIIGTAIDLAPPYLSKLAIDRYILASWYRVNLESGSPGADDLVRFSGDIEIGKDEQFGLISQRKLEKADPQVVYRVRTNNLLSKTRYYKVPVSILPEEKEPPDKDRVFLLDKDTLAIPVDVLNRLDSKTLALVRAKDLRGVTLLGFLILLLLALSFTTGYAQYYLLERTGQGHDA